MKQFKFVITTYKTVDIHAESIEEARTNVLNQTTKWAKDQNDDNLAFNVNEGIDIKKWQEKNKKRQL